MKKPNSVQNAVNRNFVGLVVQFVQKVLDGLIKSCLIGQLCIAIKIIFEDWPPLFRPDKAHATSKDRRLEIDVVTHFLFCLMLGIMSVCMFNIFSYGFGDKYRDRQDSIPEKSFISSLFILPKSVINARNIVRP